MDYEDCPDEESTTQGSTWKRKCGQVLKCWGKHAFNFFYGVWKFGVESMLFLRFVYRDLLKNGIVMSICNSWQVTPPTLPPLVPLLQESPLHGPFFPSFVISPGEKKNLAPRVGQILIRTRLFTICGYTYPLAFEIPSIRAFSRFSLAAKNLPPFWARTRPWGWLKISPLNSQSIMGLNLRDLTGIWQCFQTPRQKLKRFLSKNNAKQVSLHSKVLQLCLLCSAHFFCFSF